MGFATISSAPPSSDEAETSDAPAAAAAAGRIARASVPGSGLVSREDLGRATWLLLHTTAAQYPEKPTRRQQRDMRMFVSGACARATVLVATLCVIAAICTPPCLLMRLLNPPC